MKFQKFEPKYLDDLIQLSDENFGKNYFTKEALMRYHENATDTIDIIVDNGKAIAMNLVMTVHVNSLGNHLLKGLDQIVDLFPNNSFIHLHKAFTIIKPLRHKEPGVQLFRYTESKLNEISPFWLSVGWSKDANLTPHPLLLKFDMSPTIIIPNYWYDDSLQKNFDCEYCGKPPCTCNAVLYTKR